MTESYRPSNGTEGEIFEGVFCDRCAKEEMLGQLGCEIHLAAWINEEESPLYPKEWTYDAKGEPTCTAFEARQ